MYTHTYIHVCMCVCIYIYIYLAERAQNSEGWRIRLETLIELEIIHSSFSSLLDNYIIEIIQFSMGNHSSFLKLLFTARQRGATNLVQQLFVHFLVGGVDYEGGRSNQTSSFMRGVIVPPSNLIVNKKYPQSFSFLN